MLRQTQLTQMDSLILSELSDIDIETVETFIKDNIDHRLSVTIARDEVLFEGVHGNIIEQCVVISNPKHTDDYYKYVVILKKSLEIPTLSFCRYGGSVNDEKDNLAVNGSVYRKIVRGFTRDILCVEAEAQWYFVVENVLHRLSKTCAYLS